MRQIKLNKLGLVVGAALLFLYAGTAQSACAALSKQDMSQATPWQAEPELNKLYRLSAWFVQDGDSVRLPQGERLRLGHINTPELATKKRSAQAYASAAKQQLRLQLDAWDETYVRLLPNRQDHYGRWLVEVYDGQGHSTEQALVSMGLAFAISMRAGATNTCLWQQEELARQGQLGVWKSPISRLHSTTTLGPSKAGFLRLRGRVTGVTSSQGYWYIALQGQVAIKIPKAVMAAHGLSGDDLAPWLGQSIIARGWLAWRKLSRAQRDKGYQAAVMSINNLQMLERYPSKNSL